MQVQTVLVRRSPIVVMFRILAIIFILSCIEFIVLFGVEAERKRNILSFMEFDLLFFLLFALLTLIISFWLLLSWTFETYEVSMGEMIQKKGILLLRERRVGLSNVESMTMEQGIFGRLFRYGTIVLQNPLLKKEVKITHVSDPEKQLIILRDAIVPPAKKIVPAIS